MELKENRVMHRMEVGRVGPRRWISEPKGRRVLAFMSQIILEGRARRPFNKIWLGPHEDCGAQRVRGFAASCQHRVGAGS